MVKLRIGLEVVPEVTRLDEVIWEGLEGNILF